MKHSKTKFSTVLLLPSDVPCCVLIFRSIDPNLYGKVLISLKEDLGKRTLKQVYLTYDCNYRYWTYQNTNFQLTILIQSVPLYVHLNKSLHTRIVSQQLDYTPTLCELRAISPHLLVYYQAITRTSYLVQKIVLKKRIHSQTQDISTHKESQKGFRICYLYNAGCKTVIALNKAQHFHSTCETCRIQPHMHTFYDMLSRYHTNHAKFLKS